MIQKQLLKIIKFVLYSHIFIGVCAAASLLLTKYLLVGNQALVWDKDIVFILSSTIVLYAIHRIIGMKSLSIEYWPSRFEEISKSSIINFSLIIIGGIVSAISFFNLEFSNQILLIIPAIFSLFYVVPIFSGKRLRDFSFIKIFLIAIVWSWLTVLFPFSFLNEPIDSIAFLLFSERVLFIFAITVPFDIRDKEIDEFTKLNTIITFFGISIAKKLALFSLILALGIIAYIHFILNNLSTASLIGFALIYTLCGFLIIESKTTKNDLYYTGIIDGMMILLTVVIVFFNNI